ncbi:hypothetical protein BKA69DRAFT_1121292 [Paraphysoderma sedebokerense]|nr:hypothetical protein BKA69DRAFT_1121292 [Paraphysoderma sedebokerense]
MSVSLRKAEIKDAPELLQLIQIDQDTLKQGWGTTDVAKIIDTSIFSIIGYTTLSPSDTQSTSLSETQTENDEKIIGFIAVGFCPKINITNTATNGDDSKNLVPAIDTDIEDLDSEVNTQWSKWLRLNYEVDEFENHNTAFLSFYYCTPDHSSQFLHLSLYSIFSSLIDTKYICTILPENHEFSETFESRVLFRKAAKRIQINDSYSDGEMKKENLVSKSLDKLNLYWCERYNVLSKLKIRRGKVEDCDDLVPMFKRYNMLDHNATDYHVAEILESKSDNIKTLVSEANGKVVGFMSLNKNVNLNILSKSFQLDPFADLIKGQDTVKPDNKSNQTDIPQLSNSGSLSKSIHSLKKPVPDEEVIVNDTENEDSSALEEEESPDNQESEIQLTAAVSLTDLKNSRPDLNESTAKAVKIVAEKIQKEENIVESNNAFCISLFCIEDFATAQSVEFLKPAFALFPEKDYCLITVPTTYPEIPLLQKFISVLPKPGQCPAHSLYIVNRHAFLDPISVRVGTTMDISAIQEMIQGIENEGDILALLRECDVEIQKQKQSGTVFLVAEFRDQIVGFVVMEYSSAKDIYDQFDVEQFIVPSFHKSYDNERLIVLRHLMMNPLFNGYARSFVKEILRICGTTMCFYRFDERSNEDLITKQLILNEFVPLKPRRRIQYPNNLHDGVLVAPDIEHGLGFISVTLLYEPKIKVNTRIVIVGASDVGLSVAGNLIANSHLYFPNITLVTMNEWSTFDEGQYFVSQRCYTNLEFKQLGLDHHVRVLKDTVVSIRREEKKIRLASNNYVPYDYLILTPGVQFDCNLLQPKMSALRGVYAVSQKDSTRINAAIDAFAHTESNAAAVVYGSDIQAISIIQGLLSRDIPGEKITLIIPQTNLESGPFDIPEVWMKIKSNLEELNVRVIENYTFQNCKADKEHRITSITIVDEFDNIQAVPCQLFLYADRKRVHPRTFKAINECSLVFDELLIIDRQFRTKDPFIFAGGTATKYLSKYQTKWMQRHYDSREVGYKLAKLLQQLVDPISDMSELTEHKVQKYSEPKKMECLLPGNLHYFTFETPHLQNMSLQERQKEQSYGRDLVLRSSEGQPFSFFRIHVDPAGYIRSLTYLGQRSIPANNYVALYGLHEKYLNRLVSRYDEGIISDFVSYLNQTWAMPIFHDRFHNFLSQIKKTVLSRENNDTTKEITQELTHFLNLDSSILPEDKRTAIFKKFDESPERPKLDAKIQGYLNSIPYAHLGC